MYRVQTRNDHEAFAQLVQRWQQPVRRLCVRMTGDEHSGQDLAQETFARVFSRRHAFIPGRKFSTWLWRIAINLCHDEFRRVSRRGETSLESLSQRGGATGNDPAPDEQLLEQERAALVRAAVSALPEERRVVLLLREYEGLKFREIAEVLEVPEGTVKWRMSEALADLSRQLRPIFDPPTPSPKLVPMATAQERLVL